jgi:stage II sporulation protein D
MKPEAIRAALALSTMFFLAMFMSCREVPSAQDRVLAAYPSDIRGVPDVLVAVSQGVEGVRVSVTGMFDLLGSAGERIPVKNASLAPVRVRASGGGLAVGEVQLSRHTRLEFVPSAGEEVWLDGVPMPGSVVLTREGHATGLTAAAVLDVESYTCAALAFRADWRAWSDETLAAHAVALRTHGLYKRTIARSTGARWDTSEPGLLTAMRDGSYRSPRVVRAVNRTRGLVLTWDRRLFPAYMTESCGGATEDAANVFTGASIMPLSGVKCPFCTRAAGDALSWTTRVSTNTVTDKLKPYVASGGSRLGSVRHIEIAESGMSGRAVLLRIETAFGPFDVDAAVFRTAMGLSEVPSALFVTKKVGPELVEFSGRGRGPGVGLCQLGAEQMSSEEVPAVQILRYYYPGSELARLPYVAPGSFADMRQSGDGRPR